MAIQHTPSRSSVDRYNVVDLLERILDKGVVIAGDIRISLVNVELLTIQLRLVICSVDKAKEMGMDWWVNNPVFSRQTGPPQALPNAHLEDSLDRIAHRLERLESHVENKIDETVKV